MDRPDSQPLTPPNQVLRVVITRRDGSVQQYAALAFSPTPHDYVMRDPEGFTVLVPRGDVLDVRHRLETVPTEAAATADPGA